MFTIATGMGIGVLAGVASGLVGIGGGVVIVPALVLLGMSQREATGTSLAALLLPVGTLAVWQYAMRHEVSFRYALGIAAGLTVGALFGARLAGGITNQYLQRGFGVLLAVLAVKFLAFPK